MTRPPPGARGARSLWHDSAPPSVPRPPLQTDLDADVAIVGGGFTGLWTAYYLVVAEPTQRVVVLEREVVGFGASGRNGGWCSALFPTSSARVARTHGAEAARRLDRALRATVDEVGAVAAREGIDCHYAKGGSMVLARSPAQLTRMRDEVALARQHGTGPEDLLLLDAAAAQELCAATGVLGGTYTPHCAALHPARLVQGLADAVERRGVRVLEHTAVTGLRPGLVTTPAGRVRAPFVVRATEGYTAALPGLRRVIAPVYSLMIATPPLPASFWDRTGLRRRETFSDHRHLLVYGQRTADDRLAFGGRGAPYHLGSRVRAAYELVPAVHAALRRTLVDMFPDLSGVEATHAWGGALGVPRDWFPSVGLDRDTGVGWGGGYVGDGVAASNLAGRTLADLVLRRSSDLVSLPWVNHRSRRWEPEPLRWLGINAGRRVMASADRVEQRTGRPARRALWFDAMVRT